MTLHDRLSALAGETVTRCPAQRLIDSLPEDDGRLLADLLADKNIPTFRIYQSLRAEGFKISRDSISIHRNARCTCGAPEQAQ